MRAEAVVLPANESREEAINRLLEVAMGLPSEKAWRFKWKAAKPERSEKQNAALWGCAYKYLEKETGNDPYGMHEYFCGEFFGWVEKVIFGRRKLKPRRTTTTDDDGNTDVISTLQFMQFYEFIQRKMAMEQGYDVPDPDPNWKERERRLAEQERLQQLEKAA